MKPMPRMPRPRSQSKWVKAGILLISCCFGLLLSILPQALPSVAAPVTTTDRVPAQFQNGESLYRQTCGQCHFAIPPAVFPTQTWSQLSRDSSHYGVTVEPLLNPQLKWMRRYLQFSSRPLKPQERTPYRFSQSRYFRLLHPQVELPNPITFDSCKTCHAKATEFSFREFSRAKDSE